MTQQEKLLVTVHIPSELGYEKVAMNAVEIVGRRAGFSPNKIADMKTAVSEACTNAIEHGNSLDVEIDVVIEFAFDHRSIDIEVTDAGHQPLPEQLPDTLTDQTKRIDFRGMGLYLIKRLMDQVEVESQPGRNVLRMTCLNASNALC